MDSDSGYYFFLWIAYSGYYGDMMLGMRQRPCLPKLDFQTLRNQGGEGREGGGGGGSPLHCSRLHFAGHRSHPSSYLI